MSAAPIISSDVLAGRCDPLTTEEVAQAVGMELVPLPVASEVEAARQMTRLLRYLGLVEWNVQEFVQARYPNVTSPHGPAPTAAQGAMSPADSPTAAAARPSRAGRRHPAAARPTSTLARSRS